MKVYCVIYRNMGGEDELTAVYSTREAAEQFAARKSQDRKDARLLGWFDVEEWEVQD